MRKIRRNAPPASDIWKIEERKYIESKFPGATWEQIYTNYDKERWQYSKEWRHERHLAITHGLLDAESDSGYEVKLLPRVLYHVTSARDNVISEGLKTREQLGHRYGRGLGGGTSDTVSLTTDLKKVAEPIFLGLLEGRLVARGELTIPMMIEIAREGTGAKRPWLDDWFAYWGKQSDWEGGDIPPGLQYLIDGEEYMRPGLGGTEESVQRHHKAATPWKGFEPWPYSKAKGVFLSFRRRLTEEEIVEGTFNTYKNWIGFREFAGGAINPLFFTSDPHYLATIKPDQVAILEYYSFPGTKGFHVPGEAEYRIWDGDAVALHRVLVSGSDIRRNPRRRR